MHYLLSRSLPHSVLFSTLPSSYSPLIFCSPIFCSSIVLLTSCSKTILTPKRDRDQIRNRSYSCTPNSIIRRADSVPPASHHPNVLRHSSTVTLINSNTTSPPLTPPSKFPVILESSEKHHAKIDFEIGDSTTSASPQSDSHTISYSLSFTPSLTHESTPQAKKARLSREHALSASSDDNVEPGTSKKFNSTTKPLYSLDDDLNEGTGDEEVVGVVSEEGGTELDETTIQVALTDELKRLQDRNRSLQQELEELERRVVHLTHAKGTLEAQLEEVTQVCASCNDGYFVISYLRRLCACNYFVMEPLNCGHPENAKNL